MLLRIGIGFLMAILAEGVLAQRPVRVGVVLSGGGAKGAAHVGFLQALEELGIPIDAISGASMGALVGGYYAAGWSPFEMDSLLHSEDFSRRSQGQMPVAFGFKRQDPDPSVVEIRFSSEDGWTQDHLIAGLPTDWGLMKDLSSATASAAGDFDQLFVPFRCVASDVLVKDDTTFADGDLATAVRASMTFPFLLEPIEVDGRLLFDGGLYNNFPSDILFDEFAPDIIIGCNVADGKVKLTAQDPASQIEAMITRPPNLEPLCESMIIIEPNTGIGTFDFTKVSQAVDSGYAATMARSAELLALIGETRRSAEDLLTRRAAWRSSQPLFRVGEVQVLGLNEAQTRYASRLLRRSSGDARSSVLERSLYLLVSDEHIAAARPVAEYDSVARRFDVCVVARSERDLRVEAGGSLSSMPANFGHLGLSYGRFGRVPISVEASSTFGNFYSAFSAKMRIDWHGSIPFALRPDFTLHRWNFVRSFSTFFEDVRPSYAVLNEQQLGVTAFTPLGPSAVLWGRASKLETTDDFYPQFEFNPADTTERIRWEGKVVGMGMRRSSMPEKGMNRNGNRMEWSVSRYSGFTRDWLRDELGRARQDSSVDSSAFWRLHVEAEQYAALFGEKLNLGIRTELLLSDESLRRSYMGSILQTMPFQPTPGSVIRILERFRAYHFMAIGGILDLELTRTLRWRSEVHWFRPFSRIEATGRGPRLDEAAGPGYLFGSWLVAQTPFGLMTAGLEYFQGEADPVLLEFTMGCRIFNRSDRR